MVNSSLFDKYTSSVSLKMFSSLANVKKIIGASCLQLVPTFHADIFLW